MNTEANGTAGAGDGAAPDFPLFDAHIHFSHAFFDLALQSFERYGLVGGVNLWGRNFDTVAADRDEFAEFLTVVRERGLDNFTSFYWPNWKRFAWDPEGFVADLVKEMRRYDALGARGLKVWKDLGMMLIHPDGTPAVMDDPRLKPIWDEAAKLEWFVAVHQADPPQSFEKLSRTGLSREDLFRRRDSVIEAYPEIRFILCHNCNDATSVEEWAGVFERFPNTLADMNRDPMESGDPETVRAHLERYADRILFATDLTMPSGRPPDDPWCLEYKYGPWRKRLLGFGLSDDALAKIARENGLRIFGR